MKDLVPFDKWMRDEYLRIHGVTLESVARRVTPFHLDHPVHRWMRERSGAKSR